MRDDRQWYAEIVADETRFGDDRDRTAGNRLIDKTTAIDVLAREGEKYIARTDLTAVNGDPADPYWRVRRCDIREQIAQRFTGLDTQRGHHYTGPLPAAAGIEFATAAGGGI
jgi:hypothetical protein